MPDPAASPDPRLPFLAGGGEMARRIAAHDWSRTAVGPIEGWPGSMKTATALMLRSTVPIVMLWGEPGVMIYNDAYSVFAGGRHPALLGSNVREGWPEVADFNDNVMKVGLAGGTLHYEDQELSLSRRGRLEPAWMNLDYSPLVDEAGRPAGVVAIVVETTAKVRAERRVQGERERLGRLFEQAPGFMLMLGGADLRVDMANAAMARLAGAPVAVGLPLREALPELAGQGLHRMLERAYESGEAARATAMPLLVGTPPAARYVDFVAQPVHGEDGQVSGLFIQGSDVTDRILAEREARLRDAQFRSFAEAMPNQVWASAPDGTIDWLNQKMLDYSGLAPATLLDGGWAAPMLHPADLDAARDRWTAAQAESLEFEAEFRLKRHDGVYRWHLGRAVPLKDETGRTVRWVGTNTDIDAQKAAMQVLASMNEGLEQQLAERTADRDRMWRLSTDVMLVADLETRIVSTNPAWTTLLGWTAAELLGRSFMDFVHPEDEAATVAEVAKLSAGATTFRFENRYRRKDGSYCRLHWTAVPDERYVHAVGRDVTADREAAETLKRAESALHQAQKMESVGQLTGGVAHDFNNLLQVVSANLQLLQRHAAGDERSERYVASALASVRRGAQLASQLLAFARRQALEPRIVHVGRLVQGMEEMLRRTLGEAIEVETVISGGLWHCFVDPAQVENALLNLALNARDACGPGGRLTIEAGNAYLDDAYVRHHPDLAAGQYVMLAVTDTGGGIAPEVQARVFEPFFSTKPEGKGTGLGLSMVYGFVKQSGGHVKLYSELGQGTTVKLYLPRVAAGEEAAPPAPPPAGEGGTETILVAEDDDDVRAAAVEMLAQMGYRVLSARDAAGALAVVESGAAIDLLFTDVVMPGSLRSPEMVRLAQQRLPGLAVLYTSGYTQNAIVHGGRLDAGVELLGKPYTQEALALKVRQLLAARKPR